MENTSGQGDEAVVPAEIDRWNWGAFLLNWVWGIGNKTFIAFLVFVPLVNVAMPFVLGAKGSAWAWRNKKWESIEHFKRIQRQWARLGVIVGAGVAVAMVGLFFPIVASLKSSEPFQLAVAELEKNEEVAHSIGLPMTTGMPMGEIDVSGSGGDAELSFAVEGPSGKGTAYVKATKYSTGWELRSLVVEEKETRRILMMHDKLWEGISRREWE